MKFLSSNQLLRFFWGAAMLTLPVTSFRWFPFLGSGALVRPLALYPLAVLFILIILQAWQNKANRRLIWIGVFLALGAFVLFVIASASFGALLNPLPLRGQIYSGRVIRALLTLAIGLAFFVCAVWMNKDETDLRFTVQWLFAGLCLNLAWSGLQALTFYTNILEKEMVTHWQRAFSMRELVRTNRISGLAYEPAWLASQLATIFIPWLFASLMTGYRLSRRRWLEPVLLAFSLLTLLATYSRGGILTTFVALTLTTLCFGRDVLQNLWQWFINGFRARLFDKILRIGILSGIFAVALGAFAFLSQKDYFSNLWQINADSLNEYIVDINAGARGAYSVAALNTFQEAPWTGVGLGASGFYIYANLPDWSLTFVPEIAKQLSVGGNPESSLYPNPKNLYARLLAESGVIGFFLFLAFQFHILGDILSLAFVKETWARFALLAGCAAWLAICFGNFTQDSFATPNLWIVPGILVGLAAGSKSNSVKV